MLLRITEQRTYQNIQKTNRGMQQNLSARNIAKGGRQYMFKILGLRTESGHRAVKNVRRRRCVMQNEAMQTANVYETLPKSTLCEIQKPPKKYENYSMGGHQLTSTQILPRRIMHQGLPALHKKNMTKNISLVISLIAITLSICGVHGAYYKWADIMLHANIFHCLANVWALLYVCFMLRTKVLELILSAIIGAAFMYLPCNEHVIGLSGSIYALYAIASYQIINKKKFHLYMAAFILLSMLIPSLAGIYHLLCYLTGLATGYIIKLCKWLMSGKY